MRLTYRHLFAILAATVAVYFGVRTSRAVVASDALAVQLQTAQQQVANLQAQNGALEQQVAYEQTPAFVEKVAREQLGLMRAGDHVVQLQVGPVSTPVSAGSATASSAGTPTAHATGNSVSTPHPRPATPTATAAALPLAARGPTTPPNWLRWLQLFVSPPTEPAGLH